MNKGWVFTLLMFALATAYMAGYNSGYNSAYDWVTKMEQASCEKQMNGRIID